MSEEERLFEERLENWGRWLRDPRRPEVSYLYSPPEEEAPAEAKESAEIDLRDALRVQRAWTQLPTCDEKHRKAKLVLAMVYAYPWRSPGKLQSHIYRTWHLKVRRSEWSDLLALGRLCTRNALRRLDDAASIRHNGA